MYLIIGVLVGYYGTRTYLLARGLIAPRQEVFTELALDLPEIAPTQILPTGTPEPSQGRIESPPQEIPSPEPTPEVWGELDLTDGAATYLVFYGPDEALATGEFYPWSYRQGIFESEFFVPDEGGAVTWTDHLSRIVLWAHSGPNHTMTVLQRWIELDERGHIVTGPRAEEKLAHLVGTPVRFVQPGFQYLTMLTAWARIPPDEVEALNAHVSDLPEYLREHYPDQGWEGFNRDTLMLFFCGRQLTADPQDPYRPYWQQTRYVLGLLPYLADRVPTGPFANLGG